MTTILSANGLLEIPEEFRKADDLKPGQTCDFERLGHGEYRVHVRDCASGSKERLIDVLRSCPVKDWWTMQDGTERTSLEPSRLFAE